MGSPEWACWSSHLLPKRESFPLKSIFFLTVWVWYVNPRNIPPFTSLLTCPASTLATLTWISQLQALQYRAPCGLQNVTCSFTLTCLCLQCPSLHHLSDSRSPIKLKVEQLLCGAFPDQELLPWCLSRYSSLQVLSWSCKSFYAVSTGWELPGGRTDIMFI